MLAHARQIIHERGVVRSREPLKFLWALTISLERLKIEWSNSVCRSRLPQVPVYGRQITLRKGVVIVTCTSSYWGLNDISETAEATIIVNRQILHTGGLQMTNYP